MNGEEDVVVEERETRRSIKRPGKRDSRVDMPGPDYRSQCGALERILSLPLIIHRAICYRGQYRQLVQGCTGTMTARFSGDMSDSDPKALRRRERSLYPFFLSYRTRW